MGGAESSQAQNFVEDALGDIAFLQLWQSEIAAIARKQGDDVSVVIKAGAFSGDVIGHDEIGIFGSEFFASVFRNVVRLGCESYDSAIAFRLRGLANIGVGRGGESRLCSLYFSVCV